MRPWSWTRLLSAALIGIGLAACDSGSNTGTAADSGETASARVPIVLRWTARNDPLTFDPHARNEKLTVAALRQIYEPLVGRAPDLSLIPALAISWQRIEPAVWEFRLRERVTFHDGTPFTAADVKFSIERALSPSSDFRSRIEAVSRIEVTGTHKVRIHTSAPIALLPARLTAVFIMSKTWAETHDMARPRNETDGETGPSRHANGTGAFILGQRDPGVRTILRRNAEWWGLAEHPHDVDEVVFTPIENDATRVAAFLSGEVDFLQDPPLRDLDRIRRVPGAVIQRSPRNRHIFLGFNLSRNELLSSDIKGRNPFKDIRVRRAFYQAIDAETIKNVIMHGLSDPGGIVIAPGVNGWSKTLGKRLKFDPEASRKLLAQAGYGQGFSVRFDCPTGLYVNDEAICQAVAGMLANVGIRVTLDTRTKARHLSKLAPLQTDLFMHGWAAGTLDSAEVLSSLFETGQRHNAGGYANPRFDALAAEIRQEIGGRKRDALIAEAWNLIKEDMPVIPLHNEVLIWAHRGGYTLPITATGLPQFHRVRFEKWVNDDR